MFMTHTTNAPKAPARPWRIALCCALLLALLTPAWGIAQSAPESAPGVIIYPLDPAALARLSVHAAAMDVVFKDVGRDEPYAELDATVLGIHSAEVQYALNVTPDGDGLRIDASHSGEVIGLNRVRLTVNVPTDAVKSLVLALDACDLSLEGLTLANVTGTATGGHLRLRQGRIDNLWLQTTDADMTLEGALDDAGLDITRGAIHINSTMVPRRLHITGEDADVTVRVPDTSDGFSVAYSLIDAQAETAFLNEQLRETGHAVYGNGAGHMDIALDGGSLHLMRR